MISPLGPEELSLNNPLEMSHCAKFPHSATGIDMDSLLQDNSKPST